MAAAGAVGGVLAEWEEVVAAAAGGPGCLRAYPSHPRARDIINPRRVVVVILRAEAVEAGAAVALGPIQTTTTTKTRESNAAAPVNLRRRRRRRRRRGGRMRKTTVARHPAAWAAPPSRLPWTISFARLGAGAGTTDQPRLSCPPERFPTFGRAEPGEDCQQRRRRIRRDKSHTPGVRRRRRRRRRQRRRRRKQKRRRRLRHARRRRRREHRISTRWR